jgi:glyoxylase-like metal-dependent hydrolase (beta-lactamase superfamily II)
MTRFALARSTPAAALALWLLAAPAPALSEGPTMAAPGAVGFTVGPLSVTVLRDAGYVLLTDSGDLGASAGAGAVRRVLAAAGGPADEIRLSVDALLVRLPGHIVLIDTGVGPSAHGALQASLRLAGVAPGDVTDVLITHAHDDHVGGLLGADGKSAFQHATIRLSAREWTWMRSQPDARRLAAVIAPQVETFEPGRPILPGITPLALYGHTPGHVGYEIASRGAHLEDIGDTAHSSIVSLERPDWTGRIDEDPTAGAATRLRELKRLAASGERIFAPHFPYPGVGWIVARGRGYAWKPDPSLR